MEWQVHTASDHRLGEVTGYVGRVAAESWAEVPQQLSDVWVKLVEAVTLHHGQHPPEEWEALLCNVRPDSGNICIRPVRLPWRAHTHRAWVLVHVPLVEVEYYRLPDSEVDLVGFEAGHDALMQRIFDAIQQSALPSQAKKALEELYSSHLFESYGMHYDDAETMFNMRIP